jgi:hypothetical protein
MAFYRLSWADLAAMPFALFWQLHDQMAGAALESRMSHSLPVDAAMHSGKWDAIDEIIDAGYIEVKEVPISDERMAAARQLGTRIAAAVGRDLRRRKKDAKNYRPRRESSQMPPQNPPATTPMSRPPSAQVATPCGETARRAQRNTARPARHSKPKMASDSSITGLP